MSQQRTLNEREHNSKLTTLCSQSCVFCSQNFVLTSYVAAYVANVAKYVAQNVGAYVAQYVAQRKQHFVIIHVYKHSVLFFKSRVESEYV